MSRIQGLLALALALLIGTLGEAGAQQSELRVATRVLPPMVIQNSDSQQNGALTGFSIDLWNAIGEKLQVRTTYEVAPDVRGLLDLVRTGKVDVGISAVSITAAREAEFEFSQPMLNAGLQIMVRGKTKDGDDNPFWDLMALLFSKAILVWLGIAALLVLIPAHVVWFLERRHPSGILPSKSYYPGIFHALFWAASTLATQGEQMPRHWLARVVALLWMFTGVVFVAFYTAQLSATLTVQQIQGSINGPDDLVGKKVATTRGSTAAAALRGLRANVDEVADISDAYKALADKDVDAVVFDSPVLLYYAANGGKGSVQLVGLPFRKEDYGIVFQPNNPLRRRVNTALLQLREEGAYQRIYDKWFAVK
jgi:polar amino acid transport system substrate-binding protein